SEEHIPCNVFLSTGPVIFKPVENQSSFKQIIIIPEYFDYREIWAILSLVGTSHEEVELCVDFNTSLTLASDKRSMTIDDQSHLKKEAENSTNPKINRYWIQRYDLFSRYDEGIQIDEEGWYSVTHEEIAIKHAERCRGKVVIDCFAGVGGNTIQFAKVSSSVIAIDIDPMKVKMAMNNANVYGVANHVDFVVGDFFSLAPSLKGDVSFLSPPWGGPNYCKVESFKMDMLQPRDGYSLFKIVQSITPNIIMYLPKNVDLAQLEEMAFLSSPPLTLEIEESCIGGKMIAITAYFSRNAA
ncbi:unnamed protein product, partial [Brassica oleracea]